MEYALITGASSGIGKEFARLLSKDYALILVARREERLKELAKELKVECKIISADLSKKEECYRLMDEVKDLDIEVFINNAGFGDCGYFLKTDLNKELDMISVNIEAMHILTKLYLQKVEGKKAYLLNVASSAGLIYGGPYMATYYATKSYVTSFTQGIAMELKERLSPTYIGCLCPGPVRTEFNKVANVKFAMPGMSAKRCAKYALKMMKLRKVVIVPTITMKLVIFLERFIPRNIYLMCVSIQQRRKIQ
ncbi:MAG: SDR family oxidoreductase [Erysipelotrichaceae bacterium]|nr:SDR family oxidoreductase [Erysipelotrichaceae bacterium]